jgi:hypothetical protein
VISARDLDIFTFVETAEEAWAVVKDFYRDAPVPGAGA